MSSLTHVEFTIEGGGVRVVILVLRKKDCNYVDNVGLNRLINVKQRKQYTVNTYCNRESVY